MGSTIGSVLQGIGQTGNDVGAADVNNLQLQHQFTMDYLARQNASRGLDLTEQGQNNQLKLGLGAQEIEKQRLAQSRWQLLPGYQRMQSPDDPSKTIYRYTHVDPITQQQVYTDLDTPPPDSPEYKLKSFQDLKAKVDKIPGAYIPGSTLMSIAFGRAETPNDINIKYSSLYNELLSSPGGPDYLAKTAPGGLAQFVMDNVKADQKASSGFLTKQEELDWINNNPGRTLNGQSVIPQSDKLYEASLTQSQKAYETQLKTASDKLKDLGYIGMHTRPDEYAAAINSRDDATKNIADIKTRLGALNSRTAPPTKPININTNPPNFSNPSTPQPANPSGLPIIASTDFAGALKLGATHLAPGKSGTMYWTDDQGNKKGIALIGQAQ